jgi:hypothetical protein
MKDAYTGGCACGNVRYRIDDQPLAMVDCQCRDCQHRSGTGHSSYLTFPSRAGVQVSGEAKEWDVTGDAGTLKRHAFCAVCGSPVYLTFPAVPDVFIVHAASLDEPARYQPQFVTYNVRGHAWDHLDQGITKFEKMPPGPAST